MLPTTRAEPGPPDKLKHAFQTLGKACFDFTESLRSAQSHLALFRDVLPELEKQVEQMVTQPQKSDKNKTTQSSDGAASKPADNAVSTEDNGNGDQVDHNTRSATPIDETTAVAYTLPEPTTPGQPDTQRAKENS